MSNVFPAVILAFIAILLVLIYRSQQFKKRAAAAYQRMLDDLKERTDELMKAHGLHHDKQYPFVADNDEGFLFTFDNTDRQLLIADKDDVSLISYEDLLSCSIDLQWKDHHKKEYNWVNVIIKTSQSKKPLKIRLGTKPRKANTMLGRYILQSAQRINQLLDNILEPEEESSQE